MRNAWTRELVRFCILLLGAIIAGAVFGHTMLAALAAVSAYAGWHLYWLNRLSRWLLYERRAQPPEASGVWDEIFHLLYRHYRRHGMRKKRFSRLLRAFGNSTAAMPDGTVVLNTQSQILWFNEAAVTLLGLTRKVDTDQHIGNLVRNPAFARYLAAEDFRDAIEIVSPLDSERRLSVQTVPYGDGERLLLVRDVTRMHRLEKTRREFVANASHELRSPLTVITGYLEALEEAMDEDTQLRRDWYLPVREMRRQAERMSDTIRDLLELSRLETAGSSGADDEIHVAGLLARIRDEALALGEGPRDVTLDLLTDIRLRGAEREIRSAFSNLVFNAMRYTPEDGSVILRWYKRDEEPCLSVIDTGIGISKEHIPRITERFYRVDPSRERATGGTGLGLAIVKHALQRHGARLEVESAPGKGSSFSCVFPAHRAIGKLA